MGIVIGEKEVPQAWRGGVMRSSDNGEETGCARGRVEQLGLGSGGGARDVKES